jgi:NAD-dependent SIR2 family protein deacetylase
MPSEKAKENKTLAVQCVACGKTVSTELAHGMLIARQHARVSVPVCDDCRQKGWQPPTDSA